MADDEKVFPGKGQCFPEVVRHVCGRRQSLTGNGEVNLMAELRAAGEKDPGGGVSLGRQRQPILSLHARQIDGPPRPVRVPGPSAPFLIASIGVSH